jgi:hypothetical protein
MKVIRLAAHIVSLVIAIALAPELGRSGLQKPVRATGSRTELVAENGVIGLESPPRSDRQQEALESEPVSPYQLRRYVLDHKNDNPGGDMHLSLESYWLRLGIATEDWRGYGNCEVALFKISLTGGARQDVLLRLYDHSGWSMGGTRFLLFKKSDAGQQAAWRFLGYIDLDDQRNGLPEHEIVEAGTKRWLAITALAGRGAGYNSYVESLYEITDNGLKDVMSFPSHGHLMCESLNQAPGREFDGRIACVQNDGTTIIVELNISYPIDGLELWKKKQTAVFKKCGESAEFAFDAAASELTEEELQDVYDNDMWLTKEQTIKYYRKELEGIASGNDSKRKEWLGQFLPELSARGTGQD